mgnify:FL=1
MAAEIDSLSTSIGATTTAAKKASKEAQSAKTQVIALQGTLTALKTALGQGDDASAIAMLATIKSQVAELGAMRDRVNNKPVIDALVAIAEKINELAKKQDLAELVTVPAELRAQGALTSDGMTKVGNKIEEMKATIAFLNSLVDRVANPPAVIEYWTTE